MTTTVDTILMDARSDKRKGNYQVYNMYKTHLRLICRNSEELEEACKELAKALRV